MRVINQIRISYFLSAYFDFRCLTLSEVWMTATSRNNFCTNATKIGSLSGSPIMLSSFSPTTTTILPSNVDGCQDSTVENK